MKDLYDKYTSNYVPATDYSIDFFNNNRLIFNNVTRFTNETDLRLFIEVYYCCIAALEKKAQHNNVINTTSLVLPVIEEAIDDFKIDRAKFDFYKWLLFYQASAYYYLKDYKTARKIYNTLHQYEPENDAFDLWIEYCKIGKIDRYVYLLFLFSGFITIISLFNRVIIPAYIRIPALCFGLISCFTGFGLQAYLKRKRRKVN